jgi:iron complex transport system substrate-binding protein
VRNFPPERIICLTEETVETLYLLGEQDRIVGVTGYAVRPPAVRKEKERVAAFTSAKIDKILSLKPDLVLAFSDLQAEIVADLIKNGVAVMAYNQRDIAGILSMIRHLGATVGVGEKAESLGSSYEKPLGDLRNLERHDVRPCVYFKEWDSPMITGIKWVSELVEIAGGTDVFSALSSNEAATDRIVTSSDVIEAAPDIIVASWCGKKLRPEAFRERGMGCYSSGKEELHL